MEVVNKDEFVNKKRFFMRQLKNYVFVYPTDTIYGIGCDARNASLVNKVRNIKKRPNMPFSVIAPSKQWIRDNCVVNSNAEEWIEKLPGPYTLIMVLKNKNVIADNVNHDFETIGVRIPDNWFSQVVAELGIPIVTTSANVSGNDFMTSVDNMDSNIKRQVDLVVDDGELEGSPSTLVFLNEREVNIKKR